MHIFKTILVLFIACLIHIPTQAQEITDSIPETGVIIIKDERLDALDKRPALMAKIEAETKDREIPVYKPIVSADGKTSVSGSIYTQKGFRIVIYNGSDRTKAMEVKNNFSNAFPGVPSYVSYNVPSYKIKVGNFADKDDANQFMRKINKAFPTSFIVPDIVTIKNINVK